MNRKLLLRLRGKLTLRNAFSILWLMSLLALFDPIVFKSRTKKARFYDPDYAFYIGNGSDSHLSESPILIDGYMESLIGSRSDIWTGFIISTLILVSAYIIDLYTKAP